MAPLYLVLFARVPASFQAPLTADQSPDTAVPIEIPGGTYLEMGGSRYTLNRLRLSTRNVGQLAAHAQIRLLVANYLAATSGRTVTLDRGELTVSGTECVYRTAEGAVFPNNDLLTFRRGPHCAPLRGTPSGELRLVLRFARPVRPAVWAFFPPLGRAVDDGAVVVADADVPQSGAQPMVRGMVVDIYPASTVRRIDLLAYVWQVSSSSGWIVAAIAISGALLSLAAYCLLPAETSSVATRMAAAFSAAAALALAYAVLVPPFQAADEPNHFVGFAAYVGEPRIQAEAAEWARLSHFERIQFRPDEHFGVSDIGRPGSTWTDGTVPDTALRGGGIGWLWWPLGPFLKHLPAPRVLLSLRLVNVLVFATTVALFVAAVLLATGSPGAHWLALPLFIVPTMPFFGMYVSNHSLLLSAYVVVGTGSLLLFLETRWSTASGFLLGAGWTAAILISRSAIPLAPFVAALLVARLILGNRDGRFAPSLAFWVGVTASPALGFLLLPRDYADGLLHAATLVGRRDVTWIAEVVRAHGWVLFLLAVPGAALELVLGRLRRMTGSRLRDLVAECSAWSARFGAAVVALLLLGSLWLTLPVLLPITPGNPPPAAGYVRDALLAGLTGLRLRKPDHLTSVTFWTGFGWLDTLPDPRLVSLLAGATGVCLIVLLIQISRSRDVRRALWLLFAVIGYIASVAAYAWSVITATPADLHGRYLVGLYLSMLLICWSPVASLASRWRQSVSGEWLAFAGGLTSVTIHAYCLRVILLRYF